MATYLLSCLIVLTFLLSSTGPALAARPPQARDGAAPRPLAEPPALPAPGANAAPAIDASIAALLASATSVAAGGSHTCALTTGGGVKCWGDNTYGQLGVNPGWTPVNVVGFEGVVHYDRNIFLPVIIRG